MTSSISSVFSSYKSINLLGAILSFSSIGIAYFIMEKMFFMHPCPLCILARYSLAGMGLFFVASYYFQAKPTFATLSLIGFLAFCLFGIAVSSRHIFLYYNPHLSCAIAQGDLPFFAAITEAFAGTADCVGEQWTFLGLYIPEQVLLLQLVLFSLMFYGFFKLRKNTPNRLT